MIDALHEAWIIRAPCCVPIGNTIPPPDRRQTVTLLVREFLSYLYSFIAIFTKEEPR